MGYRVEYLPMKKIRGAEKRTHTAAALTALLFFLFILCVNIFWEEGAQVLREILTPIDSATAVIALEEFTQDIQRGESFFQALTNLFYQII